MYGILRSNTGFNRLVSHFCKISSIVRPLAFGQAVDKVFKTILLFDVIVDKLTTSSFFNSTLQGKLDLLHHSQHYWLKFYCKYFTPIFDLFSKWINEC